MLEQIKRGHFKFLVIKELSRLARNVALWKEVFKTCIDAYCKIMIKNFPFNPNDPSSIMQLDILATFSEFESRQNEKRVKLSVHSAITTTGKFNSSHKILGFDILKKDGRSIPGVYVPNKKELEIVESIMKSFIRFGSYQATLLQLNQQNIKDKRGLDFNMATLRRLLTDNRYIGEWDYNKRNQKKDQDFLMPYDRCTKVKLPFGAQIDAQLWQQVQDTFTRINQRTKIRNKVAANPYLLSTIIQTSDGSTFHGASAHGKTQRKRYYFNPTSKMRLDADTIEEEACKILLKTVSRSKEFASSITQYARNQLGNVNVIKGKIKDLQAQQIQAEDERARLDRRLDFLLEGADEQEIQTFKTEYKAKLIDVERRKRLVADELEALERSLSEISEAKIDSANLIRLAEKALAYLGKNEPSAIKVAYRMLFEKIVAVPDEESGVMKLHFVYRQEGSSTEAGDRNVVGVSGDLPGITGQEKSKVTFKMVDHFRQPANFCNNMILLSILKTQLKIFSPKQLHFT